MSRFLRLGAFLSVLFFATNVFAAGYSCPTYKKYTSCNAGYWLNGTDVGNSCDPCPTNWTSAAGATAQSQCYRNITLNKNGGSGTLSGTNVTDASGGTANATIKCYYGTSCSFPSASGLTQTGYRRYAGWSTSSANSSATTTSFLITSTAATVTYYAARRPIYTITLDNQSATSSGTTAVYEVYGAGVYLTSTSTAAMSTSANPITLPTRTGYTFGGYYTSTGGGGTQMISATGYKTSSFTTTYYSAAGTLYAKWTANCNKITLNNTTHGGTGGATAVYKKTGSTTYYSDSACSTTITTVTKPSKTNATYAGTYTTSATTGGTACIDSNGTLSTSTSCNVTGATTWYARYNCNANYRGAGTTITGTCTPSIYTITLKNYDNTATHSTIYQKYATGWYSNSSATTTLSEATVPTRDGYKIRGFYTETQPDLTASGGSGTRRITAAGSLPGNTTFTANTSLYAAWAKNCTQPDNGTCSLTINSDGTATYTASCNAGYTVSGANTATPSCSANILIINYNTSSATSGSPSATSQACLYDGTCTAATQGTMVKTNMVFLGWTKTSGGTTVDYAAGASIKNIISSGSITLYAVWKTPTCSATKGTATLKSVTDNKPVCAITCSTGYSQNGGTDATKTFDVTGTAGATSASGTCKAITFTVAYTKDPSSATGTVPSNQTCTYDGTCTAATNPFSRTGYTFNKWSCTASSGSCAASTYASGGSLKNATSVAGATITLKSTWTANKFTVSFNGNSQTSGAPSVASVECTYDSACTAATMNTLAKTKRVFLGWSTSSTATSATYTSGGSIKNISTGSAVSLYAVWYEPTCTAGTGVNTTSLNSVSGNAPVCNRSSKDGYYCSATQTGTAGATSLTTTCTAAGDGYYALAGATGQTACAQGSYSTKSSASSSCTACPAGRTTSGTGTKYNATANTACATTCSNNAGVYGWKSPSWSANTVANLCTVNTCATKYYKNSNACSLCSGLASGFYPNSNDGNSSGTSACYTNSLSGQYVKNTNDSTATDCANWTYKGSHTVNYGSTSKCDDCLAVPDAVGGVAWTKASGTKWTSYSSCVVSQTPANCASGSVKRTQSSASAWGSTTLVSTLKSNAGYYASTSATACTICPEGAYCPASATGATACATGSYTNTTGKSACTACAAGKTTSGTGKTSCDATCTNATSVHTWASPSWSANSVANLCTVSKCNANTYYTATTGSGYKNTCTSCGSNSSTSAGNTSTTCTCTTGYTADGKVGGASTSTSGCSLISNIACTSGQYLPASSTTCSACTAGYWCPSSAKTYSYSSSIQGRTACSAGTYQPDTGKTSCLSADKGYYVSDTAKTEQTPCTGATYAANTGQTSCTACPTATNDTANVSSYSYWNTGATGDHTVRSGCNVTFKSRTLDDGVMTSYSCYVDSGADTYGIDGTSKTCWVQRTALTCNGGYYNSTFNNSSTATQYTANKTLTNLYANACTSVEAGYWSANGDLTRTACTTGLTTIGYGTGANEAGDCGRKFHAGDNVIYLRSEKRGDTALNVKIGNQTFFGALSTTYSSPIKVQKGTTKYSVVNDWQ